MTAAEALVLSTGITLASYLLIAAWMRVGRASRPPTVPTLARDREQARDLYRESAPHAAVIRAAPRAPGPIDGAEQLRTPTDHTLCGPTDHQQGIPP